jgi:hypothetical protein
MAGRPIDVVHVPPLHDPSGVHHRHLVREPGERRQVVGDQQHGHVALRREPGEQLEDLRLHGHVEGRGGLVREQEPWRAGQGHGDRHPLAHAARQPVRVLARAGRGSRDADRVEELDRAAPGRVTRRAVVPPDDLRDLLADREDRRQGRRGILQDERDVAPAQPSHGRRGQSQDVAPVEAEDVGLDASRRVDEAHDRERRQALARS